MWPAGNVGPDLSTYGDRTGRTNTSSTSSTIRGTSFPRAMPPWGTAGVLTPEDIVHVVAFLQTQKSPLSPETNPERNPATRPKPAGFGDNLDPTNNPAVIRAESLPTAGRRKHRRAGPARNATRGGRRRR